MAAATARNGQRPAVVVSSTAYHRERPDLVVMAVTSHIRPRQEFGAVVVTAWKKAGLLKPSVVKPVLTTIERRLVLRHMGRLGEADRGTLATALREILG